MVEDDQKRSKRYEYQKQYRAKNRDRFNENRREWRKRPEVIAKEKEYRQRPEVKAATARRQRKYLAENPEARERRKKWYEDNRERRRLKSKEYNARPETKERNRRTYLLRKYGTAGSAVLERDDYVCRKCGSTKRISIHHIDWIKDNISESNLVVLCSSCHSSLHLFIPEGLRRQIFEEWLQSATTLNTTTTTTTAE